MSTDTRESTTLPETLTYQQARAYLRLGRVAFQRAREDGRIPVLRQKSGQSPGLVLREHCDAFLAAEAERARAQAIDVERCVSRRRRRGAA